MKIRLLLLVVYGCQLMKGKIKVQSFWIRLTTLLLRYVLLAVATSIVRIFLHFRFGFRLILICPKSKLLGFGLLRSKLVKVVAVIFF